MADFTIETTGHGPTIIRQADLEITHVGNFIGEAFTVLGKTKPIVVYGPPVNYKSFELKIRVHSRDEYDDVMDVLTNGTTITVSTHQEDEYDVAVVGEISIKSVKASPATGETYPTRYAWDIVCPVTEVA